MIWFTAFGGAGVAAILGAAATTAAAENRPVPGSWARESAIVIQRYGVPLPKDPPIRFKKVLALERGAYDIEFSRNGKILAAGRREDIAVWDVQKRSLLRVIPHPRALLGGIMIALVPPGDRIVSGARGLNKLFLWDVRSGKRVDTLDTGGHPNDVDSVTAIAAFADGKRVICCAETGVIVWDLESKSHKTLSLQEHVAPRPGFPPYPRRCHSVAFTADGTRFATSVDAVFLYPGVLIWDATTCAATRAIALDHPITDGCFGLAPDGSTLAVGYYDPTFDLHPLRQYVVAVFSRADAKLLLAGPAFDLGARGCVYTRDGKYLLIVGQREGPPYPFLDKPGGPPAIGVWEVATGRIVNEIPIPIVQFFPRIAISPDNKLLAVPVSGKIDIYAIEYADQPKPKPK